MNTKPRTMQRPPVPFFDPGPKGAASPVEARPNVRSYTDRELLFSTFSQEQIAAPYSPTEPDQLLLTTTSPREGIDVYVRGGGSAFAYQLLLWAVTGQNRSLVDVFSWFGVTGLDDWRALSGRGLAEKYEVTLRRLNNFGAANALQISALAGPLGATDDLGNAHRTNGGILSGATAVDLSGYLPLGIANDNARNIRLRQLEAYNDAGAVRYLQVYAQTSVGVPNAGLLQQEFRFGVGEQRLFSFPGALNGWSTYAQGPRFEVSSTPQVFTASTGIFGTVWVS